jgi:hypothetical protein
MVTWRVDEGPSGLRLRQVEVRSFQSDHLTWADLLWLRLRATQVYVLFFPSRFDDAADAVSREALRLFGQNTGPGTLVAFWDTTDPRWEQAVELFGIGPPPALVLVRGLQGTAVEPPTPEDIYRVVISDPAVLTDRRQLEIAVNAAHHVLAQGNPKEIGGYVRARARQSLEASAGRILGNLVDGLVRLRPKFELPGGASIQLGT